MILFFISSPDRHIFTGINEFSYHWSLLIPPENIRKPLAFWCFQGVSNESSDVNWVNEFSKNDFHISGKRFLEMSILKRRLVYKKSNASWIKFSIVDPPCICFFKANNGNTTRRRCEICSELTRKTPELRQWRCLFPMLILNK